MKDKSKILTFFIVNRIIIMHLSGVYHDTVIFPEQYIFPVNIVIHSPFFYIAEFHIFVPVAESPTIEIGGEILILNIMRNTGFIIRDDF